MQELLTILNNNVVFSIALALMLFIGLLEGVLSVIGFGLSHMLDNLFPNLDLDIDAPIDIGGNSSSTIGELFSWINKGNVPVVMLFILFLTFFGLIGIALTEVFRSIFNSQLTLLISIPTAIVLSAPILRVLSSFLGRIIPKDETYAVSTLTFIDSIATITSGVAKKGKPAEAKLLDQHRQTHYVMVEPIREDLEFKVGDTVMLMKQEKNGIFKVINDPNNI